MNLNKVLYKNIVFYFVTFFLMALLCLYGVLC